MNEGRMHARAEDAAIAREREHGRWIAWRVVSGAIQVSDEAFRLALRICAGLPDYEHDSGGRKQASIGLGRKKIVAVSPRRRAPRAVDSSCHSRDGGGWPATT